MAWEFDGETQYFAFRSLSFGLTSAPYIFVKIMRPYLDDGIGGARLLFDALRFNESCRSDLASAGFFFVNEDTSV